MKQTLIPKSDTDTLEKKENYGQISLMNTDTNVFNKIVANRNNNSSKRSCTIDQEGFIQAGMV